MDLLHSTYRIYRRPCGYCILHKVEVRHLPMKYLTTLDIADLLPVASSDRGDLGPCISVARWAILSPNLSKTG